MHVIHDAHAATARSGRTSLGRMLPCIWRKMGHFECFWMSRGPVCSQSQRLCAFGRGKSPGGAYKVVVKVERRVLATERVWSRKETRRRQGRDFLQDGARGVVAVGFLVLAVDWDGVRGAVVAAAAARGCWRRGRSSAPGLTAVIGHDVVCLLLMVQLGRGIPA